MGRALPLLVDIGVAALTGVGLHEELAGNFLMPVNLRGAREEIALRAVAFIIHSAGASVDFEFVLSSAQRTARVPSCGGQPERGEQKGWRTGMLLQRIRLEAIPYALPNQQQNSTTRYARKKM